MVKNLPVGRLEMQVDTIKELVEQIRERRKALGISQVELAILCNLSQNGISKFESNAGEREHSRHE